MLWTRAHSDAEAGQLLAQLIGAPVTVVVPGRRVNAWDLIECSEVHSSLVVPDHVVDAGQAAIDDAPIHVTDRRIYLINGLFATPAELTRRPRSLHRRPDVRPSLGRPARHPVVTGRRP